MKDLWIILFVLPLITLGQTFEKGLMTLTEFTVKQGHATQFKDGVKKWKACYGEKGGTNGWGFWTRVQGEGNVYGLTNNMIKWAEMDEEDEAGMECATIAMDFIMPHVEKINRGVSMRLPDWSKKTASGEMGLAWVSYFKVKDDMLFSEIVKEVTTVMTEKDGEPRGYWYAFMGGGENAPQYMVSEIYESYAALDEDYESPFKMYEKAKGKKKTDEMRAKWRNAVDTGWSYLWEYHPELSN